MTATDTPEGFRHRPLWLLGVGALVLAQAGLALALFGPHHSWAAVTDDRPVLSGRHPLHLYHGSLGAAAFGDHGTTTCYDPAFQAGYPKTPVFDGGSRPAELFLLLGGGTYNPAAYKLGLLVILLLVPVAFAAAARGAGLPPPVAILAGVGGIVLGWSAPARSMIHEGELDLLASGLAAVVFVPWLARFARTTGIDAWFVLAGTALLGWYFHPLVWVGLIPVVFLYYLVMAPRHGLAWHLALIGVAFAAVVPNVWWLLDWGKYWWLRQPAPGEPVVFPDWELVLGRPGDYLPMFACLPAGVALLAFGLAGAVFAWRCGCQTAAWLGAVAAGLAVGFARFAWASPALPTGMADRLVLLAAAFLVPAMAFGTWKILRFFRGANVGIALALLVLLFIGWLDGPNRPLARASGLAADPLLVGFSAGQRDLLAVLKRHTTPDARILWDETTDQRPGWNWTALLPLLTDRAFLGGLDPEAGLEHSYCAMCSRQLTGRNLVDWGDADLDAFCRWYNVGWVVARSPQVAERWARYPKASVVARLTEAGRPVVVYALNRPRSFVLSGGATWESATARQVVLTNVLPNPEGHVQLSLHMLEGLRVSPSYVRVERMPDPTGRDPIDHVRLCMPGPVPRVTLVWETP
jgi:hypothetical protein